MHDRGQIWPVAVFAHNEARNIVACLDSLRLASTRSIRCHVLANACTDGTEAVVRDYATRNAEVNLVPIDLADKANAWNIFVHDIAPRGTEFCFFIDGDVRATPGSLDQLASALARHPEANGASALPCSGRSLQAFRRDMLREQGLAGNLYALRGDFVQRVREREIRMPLGTVGEDALVGAMLKWDLKQNVPWDDSKVAVAEDAGFEFDPVSFWAAGEWKKYFRRRVRYSIRRYQNKMFGRIIQSAGFQALPRDIRQLYARYPELLALDWRGLNTLFDWLAIREIRLARK